MKKILIFLIFCLSFQISYAKSWDIFSWTPTIKELSANLEKLKEEKQDFTAKTKELKEEYGDLVSFIKDDLYANPKYRKFIIKQSKNSKFDIDAYYKSIENRDFSYLTKVIEESSKKEGQIIKIVLNTNPIILPESPRTL